MRVPAGVMTGLVTAVRAVAAVIGSWLSRSRRGRRRLAEKPASRRAGRFVSRVRFAGRVDDGLDPHRPAVLRRVDVRRTQLVADRLQGGRADDRGEPVVQCLEARWS
jgi:hypothetical protein